MNFQPAPGLPGHKSLAMKNKTCFEVVEGTGMAGEPIQYLAHYVNGKRVSTSEWRKHATQLEQIREMELSRELAADNFNSAKEFVI